MSALPGEEPVEDDELLYRRIPVSQGWYALGEISPQAFGPLKNDTGGLSIVRAKYQTIEEAAIGRSMKGYYIAVLRAGDLRRAGIEIIPDPLDGNPGHSLLPDLNYNVRENDDVQEWMVKCATSLTIAVHGPFLSDSTTETHPNVNP